MIENSKTKIIGEAQPTLDKDKKIFHFSGSGKYFPLAIQADSLEQAQKIYNEKRVPYKK